MVGRADKGLFLTTGGFTQEAKKEAIRDGAAPIELIDGTKLIEIFENLRLGLENSYASYGKVANGPIFSQSNYLINNFPDTTSLGCSARHSTTRSAGGMGSRIRALGAMVL